MSQRLARVSTPASWRHNTHRSTECIAAGGICCTGPHQPALLALPAPPARMRCGASMPCTTQTRQRLAAPGVVEWGSVILALHGAHALARTAAWQQRLPRTAGAGACTSRLCIFGTGTGLAICGDVFRFYAPWAALPAPLATRHCLNGGGSAVLHATTPRQRARLLFTPCTPPLVCRCDRHRLGVFFGSLPA